MEPQSPIAPIVNSFPKGGIKKVWPYVLGAFLVVIAGVSAGWLISGRSGGRVGGSNTVAPGATSSAKEAGILNPSFKYDTAEGILQAGGINGEGTHHLVRDGGASKYVYLTSSVVDLESFVNKKVEIWGETISAKKAGWLMDVAKIQVTE